MTVTTVFLNNGTQAVRLLGDARLAPEVKHVEVRVHGQERIISPVGCNWDSFFSERPLASEDFMAERGSQEQSAREAL
jgi:antitoxin VapB